MSTVLLPGNFSPLLCVLFLFLAFLDSLVLPGWGWTEMDLFWDREYCIISALHETSAPGFCKCSFLDEEFFLKKTFIMYMCVSECGFSHMSTVWRPEEGVGVLGTVITGG